MLAADPVLADAAELARILARAHQGAAAQLIGEGWAHARKYFSLSEKYAEWAITERRPRIRDPRVRTRGQRADPPDRRGAPRPRQVAELRQRDRQAPPDAGWLAVPLIGSDGANYGFIQASDRLEGEFTEQDEANS
jgi:hypothetical protein